MINAKSILSLAVLLLHMPLLAQESRMVKPGDIKPTASLYVNNRAPLPANPFIKLAPAAVTPRGWIGEMLLRQKNGLSGQAAVTAGKKCRTGSEAMPTSLTS